MQWSVFKKIGHLPTLAMAFLYFDVSFMVWVLLGVLGVFVSHELHLNAAQQGLMVSIPVLGGALARIPLGVLGDRIGPKRAAVIAQLIVLLPLLAGWLLVHDFSQVLAMGLLLGVAGGSFAIALPLASRWYPAEQQGLVMGIAGAGNSGTVLAALFAARLAQRFGWHQVFGLALLPAVLTLALFTAFAKDSPTRPAPKPLREYLRLFATLDAWILCLFYAFTFGGFVGLAGFLSLFFHAQYHLSAVVAGDLTALCVFSGSFLRPVGGWLADRFGGTRMLRILFGAASLGFFLIALLPPAPLAVLLLFLIMGILGTSNGSVFQIVPQRFREDIGVATGVIGAAGGLGGFLLPNLLGTSRQLTHSFAFGLAIYGGVGAILLLVLQGIEPRWRPFLAHLVRTPPLPERRSAGTLPGSAPATE